MRAGLVHRTTRTPAGLLVIATSGRTPSSPNSSSTTITRQSQSAGVCTFEEDEAGTSYRQYVAAAKDRQNVVFEAIRTASTP